MAGSPLVRTTLPVRSSLVLLLISLAVTAGLAWGLQLTLGYMAAQGSITPDPKIKTYIWAGAALVYLISSTALMLRAARRAPPLEKTDAGQELEQYKAEVEELQPLLAVEREARLRAETLGRVSLVLSQTLDLHLLLDLICEESIDVFQVDAAYLWLVDREDLVGFATREEGNDEFVSLRFPPADPKLLAAQVIGEQRPLIVNNAAHSPLLNQQLAHTFGIQSMLSLPLIRRGHVLGALMILDAHNARRFESEDAVTAALFGHHAVTAIENAQTYDRSQRRLQHQEALHAIDLAISSNLELEAVIQVVLDQTIAQLKVDAADILLMDPQTHTLNYEFGQGFRTYRIKHTRVPIEDAYAGTAAREQITVAISDLQDINPPFERYSLLAGENFVTYYATPLIIKNQSKGVLEIFHRTPLHPDKDWLQFFETLAGQTAIALENASLFTDLRQANRDLIESYDATIRGWARALELRDRATQGHTQRVTEMTEQLAQAMGISDEQLVHIRRGALLHDIGKMGIPDAILLKSEKLTKAEREIMHQHPQYAHDMLSGIPYLREALDIPYCHHERWDGSGYPRGLRAEEIPLAARIFTVADVYDALTSDRPYRKAWSRAEALAYIQDQSYRIFDPRVVGVFLEISAHSSTDRRTASR